MSGPWPKVPLGEVLKHRKEFIEIDDLADYRRPRVQLHGQGIVLRDVVPGALIKTKSQQVCRAGEFLVAEIDAKVGGFGIVPLALDGSIVSSHYFLFEVNESRVVPGFLDYFIRTSAFRDQVEAQGSTNYAAIRPADVLRYELPLPPLAEQRRVVARIDELAQQIRTTRNLKATVGDAVESLLSAYLGTEFARFAKTFPVVTLGELTSHIVDGPHQTPRYLPEGLRGIPFVTVKNMVKAAASNRIFLTNSPS